MAKWMKFSDQNNSAVPTIINLDETPGFATWGDTMELCSHGQRFHISKTVDSQTYQQILEYIKTATGHTLP
ncbi:MAG: hypothetical protein U0694_10430 [Anaerolineae bacterium]